MAIVVNEIGEVGYINTKGELAIPYQYDTMAESDGNNFHEGLCAVVVDGSHEWVSYIDKTGKLAFEGVFSYGLSNCPPAGGDASSRTAWPRLRRLTPAISSTRQASDSSR